MDLRFRDAKPTDEERAAVDDLLGPPASAWTGGSRTEADLRMAVRAEEARDQLLPALHAVNDRVGWISEGALDYICRRLNVPPAEAYGVATFYSLLSVEERPKRVLHVCTDLACQAKDSKAVCDRVRERFGPPGKDWQESPCLGLCERAPAALALEAGVPHRAEVYAPATPPTRLPPSPAPRPAPTAMRPPCTSPARRPSRRPCRSPATPAWCCCAASGRSIRPASTTTGRPAATPRCAAPSSSGRPG
ncbi:hypothetical protein GCM10020001_073740 [Nonomuraea salmonea]